MLIVNKFVLGATKTRASSQGQEKNKFFGKAAGRMPVLKEIFFGAALLLGKRTSDAAFAIRVRKYYY